MNPTQVTTQLLTASDENIALAARRLHQGGLVAFPTETVYGLGANALNEQAVARIFEAKGRPRFDPLIVHAHNLEHIRALVQNITEPGMELARRFWPGPLTLVLPRKPHIPDIVTSGLDSVAVRIPSHPVALKLLEKVGVPLAAPSANRFGAVSPTTAQHVMEELDGRVDVILDAGPCATGVESTVVSLIDPASPTLLRPGGLPIEWIESVIGPLRRAHESSTRFSPGSRQVEAMPAPGMLPSHYAPRTPLRFVDAIFSVPIGPGRVGVLALDRVPEPERFASVKLLSEEGNLTVAATRLFAALRELDQAGLDLIIACRVPDEGLGVAINDRLARAAGKRT